MSIHLGDDSTKFSTKITLVSLLSFTGTMKDDLLHVIAVISNPVRYRSRYKLFKDFEKQISSCGAKLLVVECAYGDRPFEITSGDNKNHIQVRTSHELWHKENLINIGISRLPSDWKYVAWVDADITFARHDFACETVQQLQHFDIVQMFSHAIDLGPEEEPIQSHEGLGFCYWKALKGIQAYKTSLNQGGSYYYQPGKSNLWHPGFAWAARRKALDDLGGLMDFCILGAADHHMARCLIGDGMTTLPQNIGSSYCERVKVWQERADRFINRNIGYTPGTIMHHWHGPKRQRYYAERWKILTRNGYDPGVDLKYDTQGLLQLTDRSMELRDGIRSYFRARNEDGLDL